MSDLQLVCVPPDKRELLWPLASDYIFRAVKRGGLGSFAVIRDDVLNGDSLLWLATDGADISAACVTQLSSTEWTKACTVVACGGENMDRWLWMLGEIEKYAKAEGCSVVRIVGREGWSRVLSAYRPRRVVLEKDL